MIVEIIQTIDFPWGRAQMCDGMVRGSSSVRPCGSPTRTVCIVGHDDGSEEELRLCGDCIREIREGEGG